MDVDAHLIRTTYTYRREYRGDEDDDDIACSSNRRNLERGNAKKRDKGTREQRRSGNAKTNSRFATVQPTGARPIVVYADGHRVTTSH